MRQRTIGIAAWGSVALMLGASAAGIRMNFTDSAPHGVWLELPLTAIKNDIWVSVCPPVSPLTKAVAASNVMPVGDCPDLGVAPLLKPISAVPGDVVRLYGGRLVSVNGKALPNTISKQVLPAWPDGEYIVEPSEVWLLSTYSPNSFDSRYFGPVQINQIQVRAIPLITWGKEG